MKKLLTFVLVLVTLHAFTQDKSTTPALKGRNQIDRYIDLGEAGVLLHESWPKVVNKHPGAVHYYSATGDLIWKKEVTNNPGNTHVVADPDGSVVYYMEIKGKVAVQQIKRDGTTIEKDIPLPKQAVANMTTIFCDKSYLYFLSTLNGDQLSDKKRGEDKLIIHRFAHTDFSYKQYTLDLPAISSNNNTSFWAFIGQTVNGKYLLSKEVDPDKGASRFTVVSFSTEGVVGKKITIDHNLAADLEFFEPSNNTVVSKGALIVQDMDHQITGTAHQPGLSHDATGGSTRALSATTNGRFFCQYFDPVQERLYLITQTKPKTAKQGKDRTFLILQYNLSGQLLWSSTVKHPNSEGVGSGFSINILPDGAVNFTTEGESGIICFELSSADGKIAATQKIDYGTYVYNMKPNPDWYFMAAVEKGKMLRSVQYVLDNVPVDDRKSAMFRNFISDKGEIVLVTPRKGDAKLLYFRK